LAAWQLGGICAIEINGHEWKCMETNAKRRIRRELNTVRSMIEIYCRGNHRSKRHPCAQCLTVWEYAKQRVEHCPFLPDKPTCVNCPAHCYKPGMRKQIQSIMRYSGPRMIWHHPVLSIQHFIDGRRDRAHDAKIDKQTLGN
jgi:hypothetical protein